MEGKEEKVVPLIGVKGKNALFHPPTTYFPDPLYIFPNTNPTPKTPTLPFFLSLTLSLSPGLSPDPSTRCTRHPEQNVQFRSQKSHHGVPTAPLPESPKR